MIAIKRVDGICAPIIRCDYCGAECVCDGRTAMAAWNDQQVYHLHKAGCLDAMERKTGRLMTSELPAHLTFLFENAGLTARDRMLAMDGLLV